MKREGYLSWDEYFMGVALLSAQRSKDPGTQVGACIVGQDNKILSVGYNGMPIGCKVTLRSDRMYEFMERLVNMALPRIRDFHGITGKNFDGKGNFAFGIKEQIIFPEINY
ncbi:MAG: hypothetical protein J6Q42_01400, partial [Clostridia bacterium]|nr:hypothetical protein [Clostridia bacterium]